MLSREDVIRMAREAGFYVGKDSYGPYADLPGEGKSLKALENFASLAIADFLERTGQYVTNDASREAVIAEAVAAEREACAKVAEGFEQNRDWVRGSLYESIRNEVAARIRARGKATVKESLTAEPQDVDGPIPDRLTFAGKHAVGGHSGHGGGLD